MLRADICSAPGHESRGNGWERLRGAHAAPATTNFDPARQRTRVATAVVAARHVPGHRSGAGAPLSSSQSLRHGHYVRDAAAVREGTCLAGPLDDLTAASPRTLTPIWRRGGAFADTRWPQARSSVGAATCPRCPRFTRRLRNTARTTAASTTTTTSAATAPRSSLSIVCPAPAVILVATDAATSLKPNSRTAPLGVPCRCSDTTGTNQRRPNPRLRAGSARSFPGCASRASRRSAQSLVVLRRGFQRD